MKQLCAHIDVLGVASIKLQAITTLTGSTEPYERRLLIKDEGGGVWSLNLHADTEKALQISGDKS